MCTPSVVTKFLWLRMIVLALVVGAGSMIMQLSQEIEAAPLYLLLLASYLVGGVVVAGTRAGLPAERGMWMLMVTDVVWGTAVIHYSGGVGSQFSLIFCLSIIAAAFVLDGRGGLSIAIVASVCFVSYAVLQSEGYVHPPSRWIEASAVWSQGLLQTYMHVSVFFLVGAVGDYLAERSRLKGYELREAETELKQLKVDTDNILKQMSSGVLVCDADGRVLTINPTAEDILEVSRSKVLGQDANSALTEAVPEFAELLRGALETKMRRQRRELTLREGESNELPLGVSLSMMRDEDGRKRGVIALFQDLTEVRRMQSRVRKADRLAAIGELSANIAHELRNPLASISGSIELLYNEVKLSGENKRLMELIMKESGRLDRIITNFLEFARMRPPSADRVHVSHCLEDVIMLLSNNVAVSRMAAIEIEDRAGDVVIKFDEEQMKQVFVNLIINACEVMDDGGRLTVSLKTIDQEWLAIAFKDEGPGISDEVQAHLFEPFFTRKEGGTGLGLAIANKIVAAHGGKIRGKNRAGGGAEFVVLVPLNNVGRRADTLQPAGSTL
ncbi:MAG: ATP-binding protein [bacterium]|nr:ATP-binding protein [bacterium]